MLAFAACTQNELTEQAGILPEGMYPLQIGSVSLTAEVSEQPWGANAPQTRVTESENGNSTVWETGDVFYVKFAGSDKVGTYKITDAETGTVEAVMPVYWRSTSEEQTIIAWYAPQEEGTIDVSNQTNGLAYVMRAQQTSTYSSDGNAVSLQFAHQLSKVRVCLRGTAYEGNATGVTLSYPTSYTMTEGCVTQASTTNGAIQMHKAENADYYEALVFPGTIATGENFFTVTLDGTTTANVNLSAPLPLVAGSKHDVTLRLHKQGTTAIDLSKLSAPYTINAEGDYYFYGSGSYGIKVTGGNPNIYLEDAQISVSGGNAINITGGNPTIHVMGNDNKVSSGNGAGIYVAENSTVTIQGNSTEDALTCEGNEGGAGIGGYYSGRTVYSCGDINISNVTITARCNSVHLSGYASAGIGAAGTASVGSIDISNSIINAVGSGGIYYGAAAIGGGSTGDSYGQTEFDITILNSKIHAAKGSSYASYIGAGGDLASRPANYDIISSAQIIGSSIYNESGTEITQ